MYSSPLAPQQSRPSSCRHAQARHFCRPRLPASPPTSVTRPPPWGYALLATRPPHLSIFSICRRRPELCGPPHPSHQLLQVAAGRQRHTQPGSQQAQSRPPSLVVTLLISVWRHCPQAHGSAGWQLQCWGWCSCQGGGLAYCMHAAGSPWVGLHGVGQCMQQLAMETKRVPIFNEVGVLQQQEAACILLPPNTWGRRAAPRAQVSWLPCAAQRRRPQPAWPP